MKSVKNTLFFICIVFLLYGCTTNISFPIRDLNTKKINNIILVNNQKSKIPQKMFDNGIDIWNTSYYNLTEMVINKLRKQLRTSNISIKTTKNIQISVNNMSCGGLYVGDCVISLLLIFDNGEIKVLNSDKVNSFPIFEAIYDSIDNVALKFITDEQIVKYLLTE